MIKKDPKDLLTEHRPGNLGSKYQINVFHFVALSELSKKKTEKAHLESGGGGGGGYSPVLSLKSLKTE